MTATVLEHRYSPRGACRALWERRDPEVLVSGPAGTGKSRACLEKLHLAALKYPGMRGLIVRKTQTSLGGSALDTWRKFVIAELVDVGGVAYYGGSGEEPAQYRYRNGSRIVIAGLDKASKIMSSEYDMIYVQEAIELTEDDWEALTTRLRNGVMPYQQLLADTNPDTPTHWLKVRCDSGKTVMLDSRHEDNPTITPEYMAKLDALSGVRYQRLRKGMWVAAEGIIYEEYDPAIHLIDPFEIPDGWTRYWAIDFGYTNPFVCQWWAEDPDGRLYLYRERYCTRHTVDQHAALIRTYMEDEPRPRAVICDHDAEGRATLEKELGISTVAAQKTVTDGIQAVQRRLRPAGDGRPRLYLFRNAVGVRDQELVDAHKPACTAEELPGYIWSDKIAKEQPVKENDHGADAMRYMVAERDLGVRVGIRWLG